MDSKTLRASQSERDTSVPCCLYLSEDSNALDSISGGGGEGGEGAGGRGHAVAAFKNTLIYTMQAIGKAKGRPAIGRLGGEGDESGEGGEGAAWRG